MTYLGLIRFVLVIIFAIILWDELVYLYWKLENPGAQWSHLRGTQSPPVDPRYKSSVFRREEDVSRRLYSVLD